MLKSKFLAMILVLLAALAIPLYSSAAKIEKNYKWNAAMSVSNVTINYMIVSKFAELIKERSEGKIIVEVYHSGALGNSGEFAQSVVAGSIDIGSGMTVDLVDFVPQAALFDLPNLFPNVDVMRKVMSGDFRDTMNMYTMRGGIHMLAYADAGFRQLSSNKAIRSLSDLTGQKIRVMPNPNHVAYWKALGANPVAMEFSEVFMALQQGTIDGQENPYMNIVGNNMQEVQKFIIETNHIGHIITFFMNDELYKSLPDNVKTLVDECSREAMQYGYSKADESIKGYKEACMKAGCEIITLSPETLVQFKEKADVVYKMVRKSVGDELVDTLLKQIAEAQK